MEIKLTCKTDNELLLAFVVNARQKDADNLLCEFASNSMRRRLHEQRTKGFSGWNTAQCENGNLKQRLLKNVSAEDWVDVMNLAAMLLAREKLFIESTQPEIVEE